MMLNAHFKFEEDLRPVAPFLEMGAYEALWARSGTSFKTIADLFRESDNALPSDFVEPSEAIGYAELADAKIRRFSSIPYSIRVHGAGEYPEKIRVAKHPIEVLYYQGAWALSELPSVAVVGTRNPTPEGKLRASRIVRELCKNNIVPVSGLARGIDTIVHETAISENFPTIAVIGTPISNVYPNENTKLQLEIAKNNLLISQAPVYQYSKMPKTKTRTFFPERNITMSALADATVIVEAGETSGTLTQAKAALAQGRKLFILDSCFQNPHITWPSKFAQIGAIRVSSMRDIFDNIGALNKD